MYFVTGPWGKVSWVIGLSTTDNMDKLLAETRRLFKNETLCIDRTKHISVLPNVAPRGVVWAVLNPNVGLAWLFPPNSPPALTAGAAPNPKVPVFSPVVAVPNPTALLPNNPPVVLAPTGIDKTHWLIVRIQGISYEVETFQYIWFHFKVELYAVMTGQQKFCKRYTEK